MRVVDHYLLFLARFDGHPANREGSKQNTRVRNTFVATNRVGNGNTE